MSEKYDVIVIGGGLLGCFALRELTRYDVRALLLEAREDIATGISRANTAIVYAGYDMKPGSLKAELTVRASQNFENLCRELGVRYSQCGSVMVCFGEQGYTRLQKKLKQGEENGVRGLRLMERGEVLELEPNLSRNVYAGLYAPECGTVIPWELCLAAAENAVCSGGEISLNSKVEAIQADNGGYIVCTDVKQFYTKAVINCAGLFADKVAEMVSEPNVRIRRSTGSYYVLDDKVSGFIKHIIFHEPEQKGKGLTLVPTVDGNILLGPTERKTVGPGEFLTTLDELGELRTLAAEVVLDLPLEHIIRSFGAVRPNPYYVNESDKSINDFCILENAPAFVSFIGIKTPGLTCSEELGRYAANRIVTQLGANKKTDIAPAEATPKVRIVDLPFEQRKSLVESNRGYGEIVCRCKQITEAEIVGAIHQTLGAVTVDGIKRRVGAGLGRCQGGYCTQRVIEILARELNSDISKITKDGNSSYILKKGGEHVGV